MEIDLKPRSFEIQCTGVSSANCLHSKIATSNGKVAWVLGTKTCVHCRPCCQSYSECVREEDIFTHTTEITALEVSPCGDSVWLGTAAGEVMRIWERDKKSASPQHSLIGPQCSKTSPIVCIASNGESLMAVAQKEEIHVWKSMGEKSDRLFSFSPSKVQKTAGNADAEEKSEVIISCAWARIDRERDEILSLENLENLTLDDTCGQDMEESACKCVQDSSGIKAGNVLVVLTEDKLYLCPFQNREMKGHITLHCPKRRNFECMVSWPGKQIIATCSSGGDVDCWDVESIIKSHCGSCFQNATDVAIFSVTKSRFSILTMNKDSSCIVAANGAAFSVWCISESEEKKLKNSEEYSFAFDSRITAMSFNDSGSILTVGCENGEMRFVNFISFPSHKKKKDFIMVTDKYVRNSGSIAEISWLPGKCLVLFAENMKLQLYDEKAICDAFFGLDDQKHEEKDENLRNEQYKDQSNEFEVSTRQTREHGCSSDSQLMKKDEVLLDEFSSKSAYEATVQAISSQDNDTIIPKTLKRINVERMHVDPTKTKSPGAASSMLSTKQCWQTKANRFHHCEYNSQAHLIQQMQHARNSPRDVFNASSLDVQGDLNGWGLGYPGGASISLLNRVSHQVVVSPRQENAMNGINMHANCVVFSGLPYGVSEYPSMSSIPPGTPRTVQASFHALPRHYVQSTMGSPQFRTANSQSNFVYPQNTSASPGTPTAVSPVRFAEQLDMAVSPSWNTSYSQLHKWAATAPGYMSYQHSMKPTFDSSAAFQQNSISQLDLNSRQSNKKNFRGRKKMNRQEIFQVSTSGKKVEGSNNTINHGTPRNSNERICSVSETSTKISNVQDSEDSLNTAALPIHSTSKKGRIDACPNESDDTKPNTKDKRTEFDEVKQVDLSHSTETLEKVKDPSNICSSKGLSQNKQHRKPTAIKNSELGSVCEHKCSSKNVQKNTVYVGNLSPAVDEYALAWLSGHFGPIKHVQIIRDKVTHTSRGFGFVTYEHPVYASMAIDQLNNQGVQGAFGGLKLKVAPTNK